MSVSNTVFPENPKWSEEGTSRVPFWAYTREDLYKKELDRLDLDKLIDSRVL